MVLGSISMKILMAWRVSGHDGMIIYWDMISDGYRP